MPRAYKLQTAVLSFLGFLSLLRALSLLSSLKAPGFPGLLSLLLYSFAINRSRSTIKRR